MELAERGGGGRDRNGDARDIVRARCHACPPEVHDAPSPTTLTTTVFSQCRSGWFEAGSCKQTSEGHDSSIVSRASVASRPAPAGPSAVLRHTHVRSFSYYKGDSCQPLPHCCGTHNALTRNRRRPTGAAAKEGLSQFTGSTCCSMDDSRSTNLRASVHQRRRSVHLLREPEDSLRLRRQRSTYHSPVSFFLCLSGQT